MQESRIKTQQSRIKSRFSRGSRIECQLNFERYCSNPSHPSHPSHPNHLSRPSQCALWMSAHYLQMSHVMKQYRFVLSCLEFVMTFMYVKKTFTGLYTKWDSFTPCKYKINLIRTLTYHCYQIFSSCSLLQSALDDLRKLLLQDGYPQGIINCHVNDVLGTKPKQMRCPVRMVPKKDFIILSRYLGRQSNQISECQKSFIYQCYS